jgi:hypothetical protein
MRDSTVTGYVLASSSQGSCRLPTVHGKPLTVIPAHVLADEILVVLIRALDVADLIGLVDIVSVTIQSVPLQLSGDNNQDRGRVTERRTQAFPDRQATPGPQGAKTSAGGT